LGNFSKNSKNEREWDVKINWTIIINWKSPEMVLLNHLIIRKYCIIFR